MNPETKAELLRLVEQTIEAQTDFAYNQDPYGIEGRVLWANKK